VQAATPQIKFESNIETKQEALPLSKELPKFTHAPLEKALRISSEKKEDIEKLDELYNNGMRKFRKYKVSNHDPEIAVELALCRILYQEKWKELMKKHISTSVYWVLFSEFAHE